MYIFHIKATKYKDEISVLKQEKGKLIEQKASLEHDLQRAKDKLELILGERSKDKENRHVRDYINSLIFNNTKHLLWTVP